MFLIKSNKTVVQSASKKNLFNKIIDFVLKSGDTTMCLNSRHLYNSLDKMEKANTNRVLSSWGIPSITKIKRLKLINIENNCDMLCSVCFS